MKKSVKAILSILCVLLFFACDIVQAPEGSSQSSLGAKGLIADARETIESLEPDNPIHTKAADKFRPRLEVLEQALVTYQADKDIDKLLESVNIFEEHYREFKRKVERSRGRTPEDAARILELRSLLFLGREYYVYDEFRDTSEFPFTFFAKDSDSDFIIFDSEVNEEYLEFFDKFREGQYPESLAILNSPEAEQAHDRADVAIQAQRQVIEDSIAMLDELLSFYTGEFFSNERFYLKNAKEALEKILTLFSYCDKFTNIWYPTASHVRFRWSLENKYFEHNEIMFYFKRYWSFAVGL